jgi:hypothetical protein
MTTYLSTLLHNSKIFITTPVVSDEQQQKKRVSPQRFKKETREFLPLFVLEEIVQLSLAWIFWYSLMKHSGRNPTYNT